MARRPRKQYRWPLAETLLLQALLASAVHAAEAGPAAAGAAAPVSAPGLTVDGADAIAGPDGSDLYLDVTLNGAPSGLAHFAMRNNELWASAATLRQLGFNLPPGTPDPVRLNSLQGVQADYDASRQTVNINAPLKLLNLATTVLGAPQQTANKATASPGILLNYDLYGTQGQHDASSLNAFTELRAFNSWGVLSNTTLTQMTHGAGSGWDDNTVRLDTTWSTSFPQDLMTLRIGDTLTGYLPWSRATRIAGIQLSRNFALQPYRINTPLPSFLGSATLPSDVELYVNGIKQYSGKVPAGPFQLNTIPNITGSGNAQVVLTDALGRATTVNFSLYDAHELLQAGLSDWSAELGVVRENYGIKSFDYGHEPAGSGSWRYGVSNQFTAEAHAEATDGLVNAGAGGAWLLGQAGVLSGSAVHSENRGRAGSQFELGYEWRNEQFNFSVDGIHTRGDYRDLASLYGAPAPSVSARGLIGYTSQHLGSFGMSYLHLRFPGQAATRYGSAYWFRAVGRSGSVNINVTQNLDNSRDRSLFLGYTLALADNTTLSASAQRDQGRSTLTVDASKAVPTEGGFGYRAEGRMGADSGGGTAELDYLGRYGRVDAGVNSVGNVRYAYGEASGSVAFMGGHLFATRHVDDAFALVSTDGVADVPVKLENRAIGSTDRHGYLLVTPLNSYQSNQLSIDPMQLPADLRIDRVKTVATPADRTGTLVNFGIHPVRAALVILQGADGKPLALGTQVRVHGHDGDAAVVGYDGQVYLDTLDAHNVLDVDDAEGSHCHASFDFQRQGDGIPQIGPVTCTKESAP
ncbi:fimbria/pilus outer membrane usher protein [Dyella sp.]|uniref:fimbria/pilus outer membrane usher protein n=1 Tax=Dyella sp. TaxID=1869338 RepID=UPI002ED06D97